MEMGLGRMQADTHPNHTRSKKGTLCRNGRRDGVAGTLKANKERVPLGVDLAAIMGLKHLTQHTAVLRTQVTVRGTVPPRQLRRALDIAEQEGHRPARQTSIHNARSYADPGRLFGVTAGRDRALTISPR